MYTKEVKIRVRYGETDKMGYVYYGNYPLYYEVARTESIRELGISYKTLEDMGVMMPVISLTSKYLRPAMYDDEITVKVIVNEMPGTRAKFLYEVYNQSKELLNKGTTELVFISSETRRPVRAPDKLIEKLTPYFSKKL